MVTLNDLTIIIPAHNEEEVIEDMIERVKVFAPKAHILVVCDHCTDATETLVQAHKGVGIIRLTADDTKGFKDALMCGAICATTKYVVFCMADGCDELVLLDAMYFRIRADADIVCGSRYMEGGDVIKPDSRDKMLASALVSVLARILTGVSTWDGTNAFKMWKRELLTDIIFNGGAKNGGFECCLDWLVRAHTRRANIVELPTTWRGRTAGESKFKFLRQAPAYVKVLLRGVFWRILRMRK